MPEPTASPRDILAQDCLDWLDRMAWHICVAMPIYFVFVIVTIVLMLAFSIGKVGNHPEAVFFGLIWTGAIVWRYIRRKETPEESESEK